MDFLCFTANFGKEYAANITDLVGIVDHPVITAVPGTHEALIGMTMYRGNIIAVVDLATVCSGNYGKADTMLVLRGSNLYGIMVENVSDIKRGEVPEDVTFIDAHDLENTATHEKFTGDHVELF